MKLDRDGWVYRAPRLFISAAFCGWLALKRGICRLAGKMPPATCTILYYHSIPIEHQPLFAKQIKLIQQLTQPMRIENAPVMTPGKRYSGITFDDGFEDTVRNAIPELVKNKIPACVFVTAGALGQPAGWWPDLSPQKTRRIVTAEQLQTLPPDLITIGAHTMTHPWMSKLDEATATHEVAESRRTLEAILERSVNVLSFPYGDFNAESIRQCRDAGYTRVFTTQHQNAFQSPGEFAVGRVKVEPTDWNVELRLKLLGGYSWMPVVSALKHKLRARSSSFRRRLWTPAAE